MKTLTLMMAAVMMTALTANAQLGILKEVKNKVNSTTDKINVGNGSKQVRPLKEDEIGNFIFNTESFTPGMSELNFKLQLPKPPKYYTEKWCQSTTCDYDHGPLSFYVTLDGEPFIHWGVVLWKENYEVNKEFEMTLLPLTDAGMEEPGAAFNTSPLLKGINPITYALFDMLYGGQLKPGKHTITIKCWSDESVPMNYSGYEFTNSFYDQWPSIALGTIEINVTQEGLDKLANSSSAKKLTHGGGEWVAKDAQLKSIYANDTEFTLIDVAVQTEWKTNKNNYGEIIERQCRADVLYKCKYGYRISRNLIVLEDYMGGGNYGKPSYRVLYGSEAVTLTEYHFPVPEIKVK